MTEKKKARLGYLLFKLRTQGELPNSEALEVSALRDEHDDEQATTEKARAESFEGKTQTYINRSIEESRVKKIVTDFFSANQTIIDNGRNGSLLMNWIEEQKVPFTKEALAAAASVLRDKLDKVKPPTPPPPAKPKPTEILGILPSGERQLSMTASNKEKFAASKAQLADLAKREIQQQQKR